MSITWYAVKDIIKIALNLVLILFSEIQIYVLFITYINAESVWTARV